MTRRSFGSFEGTARSEMRIRKAAGSWILPVDAPVFTVLTRSPANAEAAQLFKDNVKEYERKVKESLLRSNMRLREPRLTVQLTVEQSWVDNPEALE